MNLGMTYPGDEWKRGGGAAWAWYSYDPELKLVYYGSGNPGLWSPSYRCGANPPTQEACNDGKYDNKYSMSIFASNVDTGKVAWVYQMTPFDQWDYDGVNEPILVDLKIDGKMHKALVHFDRNGFAYVLDRTDGTLLEAHKYVTVNWAEKVDMKTGRPVKVYEHSPAAGQSDGPGLPLGDGRQGPAAGVGRSERSEDLLCADQQLVHAGYAADSYQHAAGRGLRLRERVHVRGQGGRRGPDQGVQRRDRKDGVEHSGQVPELGRHD